MSPDDSNGLRKLESDLKAGLHAVAAAHDDGLAEEIDRVETVLDRYQSFLEGKPDEPENRDLARRLSAGRLELERLRSGEIARREAVGRIRLILLPQSRGATDS